MVEDSRADATKGVRAVHKSGWFVYLCVYHGVPVALKGTAAILIYAPLLRIPANQQSCVSFYHQEALLRYRISRRPGARLPRWPAQTASRLIVQKPVMLPWVSLFARHHTC